MICFPNAKINIGLNVVGKRQDGYHNIESIFYPILLTDALEIVIAGEKQLPGFTTSGIPIPGTDQNNLCIKAYELMKREHNLPEVAIHLHKTISMGAGLGGGSADGAFALKLLNDLFELKLETFTLQEYALELGSDCPFFINNEPMYVTGRGEEMQPVELNLIGWHLVLVHPGIHVSTKDAYEGLEPSPSVSSLQMDVVYNEPSQWKSKIHNQFEDTIFKKHPTIADLKDKLYNLGAAYASMSGSGSAVYGLFQEPLVNFEDEFIDCFTWQGKLQ